MPHRRHPQPRASLRHGPRRGWTARSATPSVVDVYNASIHGKLRDQGDLDAPDCGSCHGTHHIQKHTEPGSPTHVRNIPDLCGRCHDEGGMADKRYEGTQHSMVENYKESVHGQALTSSGLVVTATCIDCHTTHGILPSKDHNSSVGRANVADTCGKCHQGIDLEFRKSIHFTGKATDEHALPMCNDCHTSHEIARTDAEGFRLSIVTACGSCHEEVIETYFETYHGKVFALGYTETANCARLPRPAQRAADRAIPRRRSRARTSWPPAPSAIPRRTGSSRAT